MTIYMRGGGLRRLIVWGVPLAVIGICAIAWISGGRSEPVRDVTVSVAVPELPQ